MGEGNVWTGGVQLRNKIDRLQSSDPGGRCEASVVR